MKRQFIACVCISSAFVLLCGCGTGKNNTPDDTLNEPVEIPVHQLYLDIDFEANLIFSTYDIDLYLDEEKVDTLPHGKHYTSLVEVQEGTHTVTFYKQDEVSVSASEDIDVANDMTFQCHIQTHSDTIDVDQIALLDSIDGSSIVMPDVTGIVLSDAYDKLTENGFINIDYQADDDSSIWDKDNWTVITQNIESGKEIDKNEAILLTCKKTESLNTQILDENSSSQDKQQDSSSKNESDKSESSASIEEDSAPDSVDYSTNNEDTVKRGDSGVYSYKSRGGTYDNYYLIDFDEGYVYFFSYGNGDENAMRTKIESGNLNDVVIITYHDGEDEWSEGLHFKWKENPRQLIMQDHNGFEYDFYTTNLKKALNLLKKKNITDY